MLKTFKEKEYEEYIDQLSQDCYDVKELFKKCLYAYAFLHFTNLILCEYLHLVSGVFTYSLFVNVSLIFCFYGLTKTVWNVPKKT